MDRFYEPLPQVHNYTVKYDPSLQCIFQCLELFHYHFGSIIPLYLITPNDFTTLCNHNITIYPVDV